MHKDLYRARRSGPQHDPDVAARQRPWVCIARAQGQAGRRRIRVHANVSVVDLKIVAKRSTSAAEINEAMVRAASQELKGILDIVTAPLSPAISITILHHVHSRSIRPR